MVKYDLYINASKGVFIVFRKVISLILTICLISGVLGVVPVSASFQNGSCGTNVRWELSDDKTTLTISGEGAINDYSFDNYAGWYYSAMHNVETLVIEEGITRIGNYAFYGLCYLKSITIPDTVTEIGREAFADCRNAETITIGRGVVIIDESAFEACQTVTDIVIPDNVKTIGTMAFESCIALKNVHIGSGVESIGERAFNITNNLETITVAQDNTNYCTENGVLYDSDKTTLLKYATLNKSSEFTVPETVNQIHDYAFSDSIYLTKVTVPDNVITPGYGTFSGCTGLTSAVYNADVNYIANNLFNGCTSLESVFIPKGITTIKSYAFSKCDALTDIYFGGTEEEWGRVTLESSNGTIANAAVHYGCTAADDMTTYTPEEYFTFKDGVITDYTGTFTKITVPKTIGGVMVTEIGENAFDYATATAIVLPNTIEKIGIKAFMSCNITGMVIPDSVETIENSAFQYCYYLKNIEFRTEQLEAIEDSTFYCCSTLEEVTLPDSIKTVGNNAFMYCDGLKTVTLGKNLESITGQAFQSTRSLENIYLAESNKHFMIVNNALCRKDPETEVNFKIVAFPQANAATEFAIPDEIETIGKYAFEYCANLNTITIPEGVKVIESNAFYGCSGLTALSLPESLTEIGSHAFSSCSGLTTITVNCANIDNSLFSGCRNLQTAIISNTPDITENMFSSCGSLNAIYIGKSVEEVKAGAFYSCTALSDIYYEGSEDEWSQITVNATNNSTFTSATVHYNSTPDDVIATTPEECFTFSGGTITGYSGSYTDIKIPAKIGGIKVTAIGAYAFSRNNITSVIIPEGVTSIGNYAFRNCSLLKSVKLPQTISSIGSYAFYWCGSLESINIPDAVTAINNYTFYYCYNLKNFKFPANLKSIGGNAFFNANLETLVLPDKLETIGDEAFSNCEFTFVSIPDSVKTIGYRAFYWSTMFDKIIIGSGVESIGNEAFYNCWELRGVYYNGTNYDWNNISIGYSNDYLLNANIIYNYQKATGISIVQANQEMWVGDRLKIEVTFEPENAHIRDCTWASSDNFVATVDEDGVVKAQSQGSAVITATSVDGGYTASCTVTTKNVPLTGFNIINDSMEVVINEEKPIDVSFTPSNATIRDIVWESSDSSVAVVLDDNRLLGVGKGKATITGTTTDGEYTDTMTVNVVDSYGSGTLGNGITWEINIDCTLVISGEGDMPDYWIDDLDNDSTASGGDKEPADLGNPAPWYEYCDNINAIYVDEGITSIGEYNFYNMYNVCRVQLPETLKEIGKYAFTNIWQQYEMDIPDSVETIGEYAFAHNNATFTTGLPEELKTIGDYAFYYHNLSNTPMLHIPENVTSIGKYAFFGSSIGQIYIPANVETIGTGAFASNDNLNIIELDSNNKNFVVDNNTLYNADRTTLMLCADRASMMFDVPSTVTKIDDYAFNRMYNFTNINLTNSVKSIGDSAFQQCNITYIYLPEGLTSIGKSAFSNCYQLYGVTIPSSVTEIPENAFSGCSMMNWINLHDGITKIGNMAFYNCNQLTQITMPKSLETIGQRAFGNCNQLSQIILNDGLETIGGYAFEGCMHSIIEIPASVTVIGEGALKSNVLMNIYVDSNNQSFTTIDGVLYTNDKKVLKQYPTAMMMDTVVVASGAEKIENNAFDQACVHNVILPETITEIGNAAFLNSMLRFINLPDSILKIGYSAFGSTQLTEVGLPNNLEVIPSSLFSNCQSLTSVTIGTGTKKIESSAFYCTTLSDLFVNGLLTDVEYYAFYGSNNLNNILFAGTEEQWSNISVDDMNTPFINADVKYGCKNVRGISVDKSEIKTAIGDTSVISATIYSDEEESLSPWWTVTDDIVSIDSQGNITANNAGTSVIIAHAPNGYADICIVYVEEGGKCGENVTWKFDGNDTLVISGTGNMDDYDIYGTDNGDGTITFTEAPWMQYGPHIRTVKIESGVTSIGDFAFCDMPELRTLEIGNTVTTIGLCAFESSFISKIHLPASVRTIKDDAFHMCHELGEITVDRNNPSFTAIDGILYDKEVKTLIKVPQCKEIEIYELPSTITEIAPFSAERTMIKALIIPEGVTTISEGAFAKSHDLMNIMLPASIASIGVDAFYGAPLGVVVYGGSEEQFNSLVPDTDDVTGTSANPLQTAVHKIYNSHNKVHGLMLDCFGNTEGGMRVIAELAVFKPVTVVAGVYDSAGVLMETEVVNVNALTDFAEFDFVGHNFINGIEVRVFLLDSITSMKPAGTSMNAISKPNTDNSASGGYGGGPVTGIVEETTE